MYNCTSAGKGCARLAPLFLAAEPYSKFQKKKFRFVPVINTPWRSTHLKNERHHPVAIEIYPTVPTMGCCPQRYGVSIFEVYSHKKMWSLCLFYFTGFYRIVVVLTTTVDGTQSIYCVSPCTGLNKKLVVMRTQLVLQEIPDHDTLEAVLARHIDPSNMSWIPQLDPILFSAPDTIVMAPMSSLARTADNPDEFIHVRYHISDLFISLKILPGNIHIILRQYTIYLRQNSRNISM